MALTIRFTPGRVVAVGDNITEDLLNDLANPTVELEGTVNTSTIDDGSITLPKLIVGILSADSAGRSRMADGYLTAVKLNPTQDWSEKTITGNPAVTLTGIVNLAGATVTMPPGVMVQQVNVGSVLLSTLTPAGAVTGDLGATANGTIAATDTIPTNDRGAQLFSLTITPKSATNILEFECLIPVANGVSGTQNCALFQDATVNALAAAEVILNNDVSSGGVAQLHLRHRMVASTTSATTFKIRVGTTAGVLNINGVSGSRRYGGISAARFFIKEITA